jgi:hypothetical protein
MNLAIAEKNVKDSNCCAICAKIADYYLDEDDKTCFALDSGNGRVDILPMYTTVRVEVAFHGRKGEYGEWDLAFYRDSRDLVDTYEIPAKTFHGFTVDEVVKDFIVLIDDEIDYMLS